MGFIVGLQDQLNIENQCNLSYSQVKGEKSHNLFIDAQKKIHDKHTQKNNRNSSNRELAQVNKEHQPKTYSSDHNGKRLNALYEEEFHQKSYLYL